MPAGAKPGERRGGRAKGTPNQKITRRDVAIVARAQALREEMENHEPPPGIELAKEIMGKFAHNCAAVAMKLWPKLEESGQPISRFPGHHELWFRMMALTHKYASDAASYQSPQFRAITVVPPPVDKANGDDAVVIDLKIFENTGTAVALLDEMAEKAKR